MNSRFTSSFFGKPSGFPIPPTQAESTIIPNSKLSVATNSGFFERESIILENPKGIGKIGNNHSNPSWFDNPMKESKGEGLKISTQSEGGTNGYFYTASPKQKSPINFDPKKTGLGTCSSLLLSPFVVLSLNRTLWKFPPDKGNACTKCGHSEERKLSKNSTQRHSSKPKMQLDREL